MSKQTVTYDDTVPFNNRADVYEYDYGNGAAGALVRRTHTDYLKTNAVNSIDYTTTSIHIRSLSTQAALGTLTLYNQNKVAAYNPAAFTGGRSASGAQFNDMPVGVFTIRTDIRDHARNDSALKANGEELKQIYGLQEIDRSLDFAEPWGTKRAALNEWDPNLPIQYRGNYLHGHERATNTTLGCICDRPQTVLDKIFELNSTVTPRVKVVVTDGAPRSGDAKPGPYVIRP